MAGAILAILSTASLAAAADYTVVWGSVIYSRPGEIQPDQQGAALTSIGAQQAYSSGQFWRSRYVTGDTRVRGLNPNILDVDQLYVAALDTRGAVGSAQAFVQGLYPPYDLDNTTAAVLDPSSITSAGQYVQSPLNGYQYPQISVANSVDAEFIFLGGNQLCPAFSLAISDIQNSTDYVNAKANSNNDYNAVKALLPNASSSSWDFDHAYSASRALAYLDEHDIQTHALLQSHLQPNTGRNYVDVFSDYAAQASQLRLTNMSSLNEVTQSRSLPYTAGSISTIAGNMLASKILLLLQLNLETYGTQYKLSALFGGYEPIISMIALLGIDSGNYTGMPQLSSAMSFELYSVENATNTSYPSPDRLRVAFKFHNGTTTGATFDGPSQLDVSWDTFQKTMTYISLGGVGDWCQQCGSSQLFCAAWNIVATQGNADAPIATRSGLSPAAAGAVGAVVALAVAALLFALIMLFGRFRFHRQPKNKSELGGFKGSAKLASDPDLAVPKNGVTTKVAERSAVEAHERTGSWELRAKESKPYASRTSLDHGPDPFADPVQPREHV